MTEQLQKLWNSVDKDAYGRIRVPGLGYCNSLDDLTAKSEGCEAFRCCNTRGFYVADEAASMFDIFLGKFDIGRYLRSRVS